MNRSFIRLHTDYDNIFYDQAYNVSCKQKLENIQYNAAQELYVEDLKTGSFEKLGSVTQTLTQKSRLLL